MADLDLGRIKGNIRKMLDMGAPETDIDAYIAEEGTTVDAIRNFKGVTPSGAIPAMLAGMENPAYGPGQVAPAPLPPPPEVSQAVKSLGNVGAAIESIPSGALFNFEDELAGVAAAAPMAAMEWYKGGNFNLGMQYSKVQRDIDQAKIARRRDYPVASLVGELGGGLATGFGAVKSGATLAGRSMPIISKLNPRAGQAVLSGTESALQSGLSAAGDVNGSLQERVTAGIKAAPTGYVFGHGLQSFANVGSRVVGSKVKLPTANLFRQEKNAFYDLSEKADMKFKPEALARLKENMRILAKDVDPDYEKATASKLKLIEKRFQKANSLREMDDLRQGLQREIDNVGGGDQDKLIDMKRALDSFLDNAAPSDYTGGTAAIPLLKDARIAVRKMKQLELLETIEQNADQFKTLSPDQAMISGIRQITKNPAKMRQFDKNVQDMLRDIGSSESMSAKMERLGGIIGAKSGGLAALIEASVLGGIPWASIVATGTSVAVKKTGEKMASRKLKDVKQIIGGRPAPTLEPPNIGTVRTGTTPLLQRGQMMINDPGGEGHGQTGQMIGETPNAVTLVMPDGSTKTVGKKLVQPVR